MRNCGHVVGATHKGTRAIVAQVVARELYEPRLPWRLSNGFIVQVLRP